MNVTSYGILVYHILNFSACPTRAVQENPMEVRDLFGELMRWKSCSARRRGKDQPTGRRWNSRCGKERRIGTIIQPYPVASPMYVLRSRTSRCLHPFRQLFNIGGGYD